MPTISARHGDIFEGGMDVTVLPCSGKGTFSSATRRWIEAFSLPVPADLPTRPRLGQISTLVPFPGNREKTKFVIYAASVFNDATSIEAIESIARALGEITVANQDVRLIEAPLLGTGAGRLSATEAIKALDAGFRSSAAGDGELLVFAFAETFKIMSEVLGPTAPLVWREGEVTNVTLAKPKQNLALPYAVQKRVDSMFAGSTGMSGPEIIEFFAHLDPNIEQYSWSGGMPSRKQILQDCLARFSKEQQLEILSDMLRPEHYKKYTAPVQQDQDFLLSWISSQKSGEPMRVPQTANSSLTGQAPQQSSQTWDVFVSHASEDKDSFARPLADALRARGLKVWFDAFALTVGDSLRRSIDRGLAQSRFGIVILSEAFFQKHWPQLELDGLVAREAGGHKVILPVWHGVDEQLVRSHSPILADRVAVSSVHGLEHVVVQLMQAVSVPPRGTVA